MFKSEISTKKILIFLPQPRLVPAPDPTGVKILLARVSTLRAAAPRMSGHKNRNPNPNPNPIPIPNPNPRNPSQQNFDAGWIGGGRKSGVWQKKLIFFVEFPNLNIFVTLIYLNHAKYGL